MTTTAFATRVAIIASGVALTLMAAPVQAHADEQAPLFALVDAAAARLQTADAVAASKWTTGGAIEDPAREQQVIDAVIAAASDRGVVPGYVAKAFRDQIDATVGVQYERFSEWKLDPSAAPTTAPNLSDSRAAIDALNRTMVSEIAEQWDSLHSPACLAELDDATNAVVVARGLDGVYPRALSFATRSYCL
ncbi:chorismate mutase [Mycolicibacterium sp.]|uniref:chorismate mutase n=1 Tax=Mycolicibacterium sp. TaxID=2320850 RepID=UPI001A22D163|nr:chorismate mutase [Mycolicibacterium sp.]MBJ7336960.1 chorismate mutase [Mycolicibacterium sp.]